MDIETIRAAATEDDEALIWVQRPDDRVMPGSEWAYSATAYGLARIGPDGSWQWMSITEIDVGSSEDPSCRGKEPTMEAARELINTRWRALVEASKSKPMTDAQKIAAYKRMLVSKVNSCGPEEHYRALSAVKALDRAGWLEACPTISTHWIGYFPSVMLIKLRRLGKLPKFSDLL